MKKLGFGLMRLPLIDSDNHVDMKEFKEMIDNYMSKGYNYFDTAHIYLKGESEKAVKEALVNRYPRESFILTSKLPIFNINSEEEMEMIFNQQLERCGVEYFDYYLLHNVSSKHENKFTKINSFKFIMDKKKEGKIKHIGISSHDTPEFLENILVKYPEIEVVQLQINYLDWEDPVVNSRKCYEVAKKYSKEVIIMEPLKGGGLLDLPENAQKILERNNIKSPLKLALNFCRFLDVMIILSGMQSVKQIKENISIFNDEKTLTDDEFLLTQKISKKIHESSKIMCTSCNYCIDYCPQEIRIPKIFEIYNSQYLLKKSHNLKMYYNNYSSKNNPAKTCIKCNKCTNYCPQHINIPEKLEEISEIFD